LGKPGVYSTIWEGNPVAQECVLLTAIARLFGAGKTLDQCCMALAWGEQFFCARRQKPANEVLGSCIRIVREIRIDCK